ncbi:MAG TPA: DUF3108 domain-containing protein [Opitutaceae bacterium]|jgi:hypothetical protein
MTENLKRIQKPKGANAIGRIPARFAAALAALALARGAPAAAQGPAVGLANGESLVYSVRWGFIPSVGRIRISAEQVGEGPKAILRVTTTTATWGLARGLFPFDGRGESIYQASTGTLLSISEWSSYQNKQVKDSVIFNYGSHTASFTDDIHPEKSRTLRMPEGDPADLILALIRTRSWNLQPGQKRDALVIFKDQFYPLTIHAEQDPDYVFSSMGLFKSVVLVPMMEKTPPIGMFKNGSTVRVWIETNDSRHLPVRFEVGFRFGTGTATLLDYTPPGGPLPEK